MDLFIYQDENYKSFQQKLVVSNYPLIGVRLPILRKISKKINFNDFNFESNLVYYEEILLLGMVIARIEDERIREKNITKYLSLIDCWSICDTFCSSLTFIKENKDKYFDWIISYLKDTRTFYIRFSLVLLLKYYTDTKYLDIILSSILLITNHEYYVNMAIAWLLCELYVIYGNVISKYVLNLNSDIQKMYNRKVKDSYKVRKEKENGKS